MASSRQTTFEILESSILSKPRMMGTPAEKETTAFLLGFLTRLGLKPYTEEIKWSTSVVVGRRFLALFLGLFVCLLNITLGFSQPADAFVSIPLAILGFAALIFIFRGLRDNKFDFLGQTSTGKNVICEIEPVEEKDQQTIIYFTAHSDSVATNQPRPFMFLAIAMLLGFMLITLLTLASSILSLISFYSESGSGGGAADVIKQIISIAGLVVAISSIPSYFARRINTSPGACDNGSGSAILLSLAEHFAANPLANTHMNFIWCTAEEWGLFGSKGYVAAHKEDLLAMKDRSYVINVDMVGTEFAYVEKGGLIRKKPLNEKLNGLIAQVAEETGIEVRAFSSPMSGNSDHAPFKKEEMEVCFFLAGKDAKIIHSAKDSIEKVQPEKLDDAVALITKLAEKLDDH